jgi:hypothetical protein
MTVWVWEFKDGVATGVMIGYATRERAELTVVAKRYARDNDPVWSEYKRGNYDWRVDGWTTATGRVLTEEDAARLAEEFKQDDAALDAVSHKPTHDEP